MILTKSVKSQKNLNSQPTFLSAAKRRMPLKNLQERKQGDGLLKELIVGSMGFADFLSDGQNVPMRISHCFIWLAE